MARKGRNIYRRKDGRWEGRIKKKASSSGWKYKSFYGRTYGEVKYKMEAFKQEACPCSRPQMTVAEAIHIWLKDNRSIWKSSTYACYMQLTGKYILPELGTLPCSAVSNHTLLKLQQKNENLSGIYLKSICGIVIRCLKYINIMYEQNFTIPDCIVFRGIQSNMPDKIQAKKSLLPEHLKILEAYLQEHLEDNTCVGILLAMYTGIRIGELCALQWEDIDLKNGILCIHSTMQRIRQFDTAEKTKVQLATPKSEASTRNIPIPQVIRARLEKCACIKKGYVVKGRKKEFAEPRTIQYRLEKILETCGIPKFNFHRLRHAFASLCLMKGFDLKSLSELMGHASIQTTMNIYVHSNEERKKALMERLNIFDVA